MLRAVDEELRFKIWVANTRDLVEHARRIHNLNNVKTINLGKALIATTLMSARIKSEKEKISIRIFSPKDIGSIVTVGKLNTLKGYVIDLDDYKASERGSESYLSFIEDNGYKEPYVGTVSLQNADISDALGCYLNSSEQTNSFVYLDVRLDEEGGCKYAGGMVVQRIPDESNDSEDFDMINRINMQAVKKLIDKNVVMEDLLAEVFTDCKIKKLTKNVVAYKCDCTRDGILAKVLTIGYTQITQMLEQDCEIEASCPFCTNLYKYDKKDFEEIFKKSKE